MSSGRDERSVHVVGGGPGGLLAARLIARRHPGWRVVLHERLPAEQTFGFGVGLTGRLLAELEAVDPELHEATLAQSLWFSTATFRLPHATLEIPGFHRGVAVGRSTLLRQMTELARQAGVDVRVGDAPDLAALRAADLVIAADGVSSGIRTTFERELGATVNESRSRLIWCGSDVELGGTVFSPAISPAGVFTAHAYPYGSGQSTYVIETDDATLAAAGLDRPAVSADPAASDTASLRFLSDQFADMLEGRQLLGNKSQWIRFRTVACERWHTGNIVFLGDSVASAHPSLGSGTKLAMESAITLANVLDDADTPRDDLLEEYDRRRRPAVTLLQRRAARSQQWWDTFPTRLDLEPNRLAMAFLTRAGTVSIDDISKSGPDMVRRAAAAYAGVEPDAVPSDGLADWVVDRPFRTGEFAVERRIVPAAELEASAPHRLVIPDSGTLNDRVDAAVDAATELLRARRAPLVIDGDRSDDGLIERLAIAERVGTVHDVVAVGVTAGADQAQLIAGGLVGGQTNLAVVA